MIQFISDTFTVNLKHLARHIKDRIAKALQETKKKKNQIIFQNNFNSLYCFILYLWVVARKIMDGMALLDATWF